jgi:hypothetical protein
MLTAGSDKKESWRKLRDWVQFNIAKSHKNEIWSENLLGEPTFPRGVDFLEFFEETKSA